MIAPDLPLASGYTFPQAPAACPRWLGPRLASTNHAEVSKNPDRDLSIGSRLDVREAGKSMKRLWAPWRMEYVGGETAPSGCFLCLASDEDERDAYGVVHRSELTLTLLNRFPYASGHLLVVPRRHATDLVDLDAAEASAMMVAAQRAVAAVRKALGPDGFNIGINQGAAAGASVDHVHTHIVPRWNGDTNFMPIMADVKVLPEHLAATRDRIRAVYADDEG